MTQTWNYFDSGLQLVLQQIIHGYSWRNGAAVNETLQQTQVRHDEGLLCARHQLTGPH